jgi:hypothetical protein
MGGEQGVGPQ